MLDRKYTWVVDTRGTPTISRRCHNCSQKMPFASSGKFRVNGNHKLMDVWLIYKCQVCKSTWNREVISRTHVSKIDGELLKGFQLNDSELAWEIASDVESLREISRSDITFPRSKVLGKPVTRLDQKAEIELVVKRRCWGRVDQLLSEGLGISRNQLRKLISVGLISTSSATKNWSRKPPFDGQIVFLNLSPIKTQH